MKQKQLDLLEEAVAFAVKHHTGLFDDSVDPVPYATHPMEVMRILRYLGGVTDPAMLCAAALHDTVERSGADPKKVRKKFGMEVAMFVEELTRSEPSEDKAAKLSKSKLHQLRFDMLLQDVREMSPRAKVIKLADRISNLRSSAATKSGKLPQYLEETRLILDAIGPEANAPMFEEAQRLLHALA
jgi:guanosine-3',5'-bis(diphosphate) 3'-pyrophosphohydrolase